MQCKDIPDREVIQLAADWQDATFGRGRCEGVYDALCDRYGDEYEKVCWRKIERLVDRGFLEYGTSPQFAWPTDEGRAELEGFKAGTGG